MIYSELSGGLGNQFFRYAFARAYVEKRQMDDELVLNFNQVNRHGASGDIENFHIMPYGKTTTGRLVFSKGNIQQKIIYFLYGLEKRIGHFVSPQKERRIRHKWIPILRKNGILLVSDLNEDYVIDKRNKDIFIFGTFENPKYFSSIKDILQTEFIPKNEPLESNRELYEVIDRSNSVCVNVRRGDYLKGKNRDNYFVCDENYYRKAIETIKEKVDNPVFIFFSNDIDWVKNNLSVGDCQCYYESGNDPVWETFRLMSRCKHFIISNSTFHWWAQYMGRHPQKIVVAPSRWYRNPNWNSYLITEDFVTISV